MFYFYIYLDLSLLFTDDDAYREIEVSLFEAETMKNLACLETRIRDMHHLLITLQDKLDDVLQTKKEPTGCGFACTNNTFKI